MDEQPKASRPLSSSSNKSHCGHGFLMIFLNIFSSHSSLVYLTRNHGAERFSRDVELMTGSGVPVPIRFCWCIFCPLTLFIVFICILVTYEAPTYDGYKYPAWSTGLGFFIGLLPGIPVPVLMAKELLTKDGSFQQRLAQALEPATDWVPIEAKHVQTYRQRQIPNPTNVLDKIKLNLLGPDGISS